MTLQELKKQAAELNISVETVRDYGDLRKIATWEEAIADSQPQEQKVAETPASTLKTATKAIAEQRRQEINGMAGDSVGVALQPKTCATCPYFVDRGEGIPGWCNACDHVARPHHARTIECDHVIATNEVIASQEPKQLQPVAVEVKADSIGDWCTAYNNDRQTVASILKSAFDGLYVAGKERFPNLPKALTALGLVMTTLTMINQPVVAHETTTVKPPKEQSPHRGSGRREALRFVDDGWRMLCKNDAGKQYEISEEYCTCEGHRFKRHCYHREEYLHRLAFNLPLAESRTTPAIKVECSNEFPHVIHRCYFGKQMIGKYYQTTFDNKWLVEVAIGLKDFNRYDTKEQAKAATVAAWNEAERLREEHRSAVLLLY